MRCRILSFGVHGLHCKGYFLLLLLFEGVLCTDPVISPSPSASAVEGQNLTLTCTYPGTETVTAFAWSQNGIVEGSIRSMCKPFGNLDEDVYAYACPSNKTFTWTIKNVTQDEHGKKWRCDAVVNNVYIPSQNTTVDVAVPITRVIMTSPANNIVRVIENIPSVEFVCETTAGRPQATVTWYRTPASSSAGKVEITGGSTTSRNVGNLIIVTGRLSYVPPRSVDGWLIYCTASNVQSDVKTSTRKPSLNVLYAPTINSLSDVSILDGSALSKTCVVTAGNPTQTSYSWTRTKGGLTQTSATLTIARIKKGDGDTYTCAAFNTMSPTGGTPQTGSDSASFQLVVLYPPTTPIFTISSVSVSAASVIQGRNILMTCTSSSNPPPTYRWNTGVTTPVLTLNNIQISENGSYACTVTNTMTPTGGRTVSGTNLSTISIHVLFPPSTPILTYGSLTGQSINTSPVKVVKGDDVKIGCSSSGDPEPAYRWSSQSGASQMLVINNIQTDTTRTCTATNTMVPTVGFRPGQKSATSTVSINVMYGPTDPSLFYSGTSSIPTTVSVTEGSTFPTVTCGGSSSNPSPSSYSWSSSVNSTSGSLNLVNVGKNQAGIFTCHVQNIMVRSYGDITPLVGRNSKTFTLNVLYAPVVHSLSNKTIVEGNPLTETCHVTPGIPADTSYRWTRSNGGLTQNSDTLSIASVTKSHADTYTCRAQNTMIPTVGEQQTGTDQQSFILVVLYKASITSFIETNHPGANNITVDETDRVTFRCEVDSNPVSTIQIWNEGVKKKEIEHNKLDYSISKVTCQDAGLYTCTGFNSYNGDSHPSRRDIQLYVRCSPRLSEGIPTNVTSAQHEAASVSATIVAYPEPTSYVWAKFTGSTWSNLTSSRGIQISSRGLQSNFTILDVKQADYGQYRLTVTNNVSEFQQLFYITAQDKPDAPTDLQHIQESVTETSVVIKWTPGFDGGLQQTFYVYYRPVSTTMWTVATPNYGSESTNVTLTGLNAGSTYEVQVYAINSLGNSSSVIFTFKTQVVPPTKNYAGLIGGAVGGTVGLILIIAIIVLAVRRLNFPSVKQKRDVELNNRHVNAGADNDSDDEVITENATYDSAGPRPQDNPTAGTSNQDNTYAIVNKHNKPLIAPNNTDVYAEVKKPKKKDNVPDIYAMPMKKNEDKAQGKPKPKEKEKKKPKDDKNKKKDKGKQKKGDGDVYENAPAAAIAGAYDENPYENPEDSIPSQPKKNVNKDGLVYADLSFKPDPKGQGKLVIHGLDDMTEYVQVDFTKKAEPLPDSDEEDQNANTKK